MSKSHSPALVQLPESCTYQETSLSTFNHARYDGFGQLAAEYRSTAGSITPSCTICYLTTDYLGITRMVTDSNGNVVARHDYLPFGEEVPAGYAGRNGPWGGDDSVTQRFTGQIRDAETNLDFFNARYMSAAQGRFLSPDPFNAGADPTDPQTWNAYAYVRGNPLNATDPSGMCASKDSSCFSASSQAACKLWQFWCWASGSSDFISGGTDNGDDYDWWLNGTGSGAGNQQPLPPTPSSQPPNTGTVGSLAACAASKASSVADLLQLPKDNFWAQAFLGNDFATATNVVLGIDRGTNLKGALVSNPTPLNATSVAVWAAGKKVVDTGGLVLKETPGGTPYAVSKLLPLAATAGGKFALKGLVAFSAAKLLYDGAAFGYAELQCGGVVQ